MAESAHARRVRIIGTYLGLAEDVVRAAEHIDIPLSVACAMIQMETGGRNVYGHDPVKPGQIWGGHVTWVSYKKYKFLRKLGFGNQGVGPCQLTSSWYQDQADLRGGCWKPLHNMTTAFAALEVLHRQYGSWRLAFQHYNGGGPAAVHYGYTAEAIQGIWHRRFETTPKREIAT